MKDSLFARHLLRQRGLVAATAALLLMDALLTVALPWPVRFAVDHALAATKAAPAWAAALPGGGSRAGLLALSAAALALVAALAALVQIVHEQCLARAFNAMIEGARRELIALVLSRQPRFVEGWRLSDVVGRISSDTESLETLLQTGLPTLLRSIPVLAMILIVLARLKPALALAALDAIAAMYGASALFSSRVRAHAREARRETAGLEHSLLQALQAFPLVKSLSLEAPAGAALGASCRRAAGWLSRAELEESLQSAAVSAAKHALRVAVLVAAGRAVLRGELALGDLVLFLSYVEAVSAPVGELSRFAVRQARARVALERLEQLAEDARRWPEAEGELPAPARRAALRLEGVGYAHPGGRPLLEGFSAAFAPGDLVAVAGPSGAGKTTFLKLLNRLLEPAEGSITLGGVPLSEYRLADLRRAVTLVPQETFFWSGTIRENLALASDGDVGEGALWEALERAGAARFVARAPEGLDTRVGEGGLRLSGGESRRLGVARAFVRPRRAVFVFDEPTSGLDAEAAESFLASARALARDGSIVLWSTHRREELARATRVLLFSPDGGPRLLEPAQAAPEAAR